MSKKFVDFDDLSHYTVDLKAKTDNLYVGKEAGKGLSSNDFTNALKKKYDDTATAVEGLTATGGEANLVNDVKVNGDSVVTDKIASITVPTKVSDLSNDSGYQTASQVNTAITGKGYQTADDVDTAITNKGYQTASQVNSTISSKGYQTSSQVETAITSKGYQTEAQVNAKIKEIVGTAPEALDTLQELATALGNDADFATNLTTTLSSKANTSDLANYVKTSDIVDITNDEIDGLFTNWN